MDGVIVGVVTVGRGVTIGVATVLPLVRTRLGHELLLPTPTLAVAVYLSEFVILIIPAFPPLPHDIELPPFAVTTVFVVEPSEL